MMLSPPRVSNANARALLDLAGHVVLGQPNEITVARAAKRSKIAGEMLEFGAISEHEYGAQRVYEAKVTADAVDGGGEADGNNDVGAAAAPAWFAAAMETALAPMNNRLDNIENRLDNIENRLDNIENRTDSMENQLHNIEARQKNAVANDLTDPLQPLLNAGGQVPPWFPGSLQELCSMTGRQMKAFLNHYDIPHRGTSDQKNMGRIKKFIGMKV